MMKKIRQVVRVFDVFSAPITFNFDGQEEYKSFVGGVSTIIVSFLIIVSFQVGSRLQLVINRSLFQQGNHLFRESKQLLQ